MISFRFHVVSIVAVFLALAVGVVMGYGVLGQPTVQGLRNRIDTVEANADARRRENDQLKTQVERLDGTIDATGSFALTDRLLDVPVLLVAVRGLDGDTVKRAVDLARRGGAAAPGVLWLEEKLALRDDSDASALARAVGSTSTRKTTIRQQAWNALADRLGTGRSFAADVLRSMADAGFVTFEGVGDAGNRSLAELGGRGLRIVLVAGADGAVPPKLVSAPFARAAVDASVPLVAAELYKDEEGQPERGTVVASIRGSSNLAKNVSTVDDFDDPSGPVVALLALSDLGRGVVGHYGFGNGASAAAPPWWQP